MLPLLIASSDNAGSPGRLSSHSPNSFSHCSALSGSGLTCGAAKMMRRTAWRKRESTDTPWDLRLGEKRCLFFGCQGHACPPNCIVSMHSHLHCSVLTRCDTVVAYPTLEGFMEALGLIETKGLVGAIEAADAMV